MGNDKGDALGCHVAAPLGRTANGYEQQGRAANGYEQQGRTANGYEPQGRAANAYEAQIVRATKIDHKEFV
ncbi:MAG: hypothetical protein IH987_01665 [Planctomycetes bacterium]|nr:hypothetical protein [Planctomycetota bacterium]